MVEIGSLGTRVMSAVNAIAPLAGTAAGWLSAPMANGGIEGIPAFMLDRMNGFKIANPIITTQIALGKPAEYPIAAGLTSAVVGFGIKEVGQALGVSLIERAGSAFGKFGAAECLNSFVAAWIYEAKNNPHGAEGGPASGQGAYVSAPTRGTNTIDVDNPQGLAPLYSGSAPDYR